MTVRTPRRHVADETGLSSGPTGPLSEKSIEESLLKAGLLIGRRSARGTPSPPARGRRIKVTGDPVSETILGDRR